MENNISTSPFLNEHAAAARKKRAVIIAFIVGGVIVGIALIAIIIAVIVYAVNSQVKSENIYIKTRDNVDLFTHIDRPLNGPQVSILLTRTPYGCDSGIAFVQLLGYAYVCQEFRGTFRSAGSFSLFSNESTDAEDTVSYLVAQPWSNKKVFYYGASALSIAGYMADISPLVRQYMKGQCQIIGTSDLYDFIFQQGAMVQGSVFGWLNYLKQTQFINILKAQEAKDAIWIQRSVARSGVNITIPTVHITGWYDIFLGNTIDAFNYYRNSTHDNTYIVIGGLAGHCNKAEISFPSDTKFANDASCLDVIKERKPC